MKKKGNRVSGPFRPHRLAMAIKQALPWLMGGSVALMTLNSAHGSTAEINAAFTASQLVRQFTLKNTVSQVNLGLQPRVTDPSGTPLAPAMGATISGYLPADMGTIPSTLSLPQRDGAGRPLGYCAWNNNSNVASGGYLAGLGASTPVLYAVVSAGLNGTMETSCAYILSQAGSGQPVAAGDDYVEFRTPYDVASAEFKTSVPTYTDLVAVNNPSVGEVRLVRDTNRLYAYRQTGGSSFAWAPVSIFSDDSASNGPNAVKYLDGKVTVADFAASTATLSGNLTGTTATFSGGVTANAFTGNASGLTDLNASNISSGMLSPAYGGTGVDGSAAAPGTLLIGNGAGFSLGTLTAGAGVSVLNSAGGITIANTGVLSITGTPDQIIATGSTGDVTLSLPQSISATSTPTFAGMVLNGVLSAVNGNFTGTVSAKRLILQDSDGGVNYPNTVIGVNNLVNPQSGYGDNVAIGPNALASNLDGDSNIAIGNSALQYNTGGFDNLAIGVDTMRNNTDGYWNTALGNYAMYSNTTGEENVAMGYLALEHNTTGDDNVAVGLMALDGNSTGNSNSAFGPYSLWRNDSGSNNVAFGDSALEHIVTGSNNTAIGSGAGLPSVYGGNSGGNYNTFLGSETASNSAADLNYATAVGAGTIINTSNTIVLGRTTDATVIGATGTATSGILQNKILQVTGDVGISGNLTIGGTFTATGFSGNGSGLTNLNASNISSGMLSPAYGGTGVDGSTAANGQLLIGNGAGYTLGNISGTANQINVTNGSGTITLSLPQDIATTSTPTFGGMNLNGGLTGTTATFSGQLNAANIYSNGVQLKPINKANIDAALTFASDSSDQTYYGQPNLALGSNALGGAYKGAGNVAIGQDVLGQIVNTAYASDGTFNTGVGYQALYSNTTGYNNVATGFHALYSNTTGADNTATGNAALASNTTGYANAAMGDFSLASNTTGFANVAMGGAALANSTTGNSNLATGFRALYYNTTGSFNTATGRDALHSNTSGSYNSAIGNYADVANGALDYASAFGASSKVSTSNTVVLGALGVNKDGTVSNVNDSIVIGATGTANSGILQNKILQVTGDVGISGNLTIDGTFTATGFNGNGSGLTDLNASNISSGMLSPAYGGTGVDGSTAANGQLLIGNGAGYTLGNISGTANQINVTNGSGTITLSLPQDIATTSTPTFGGMNLNGSLTGTTAAFSGQLNAANIYSNGVQLKPITKTNIDAALTFASDSSDQTYYGQPNLALGSNALGGVHKGAGNVAIGQDVLGQIVTTTNGYDGTWNTGVGYQALISNTTGSRNVASGYLALYSNTTGSGNVATGSSALLYNTTGSSNVATGPYTLLFNTTGSYNVATGSMALFSNTTGGFNVAVGNVALLANTTGNHNVGIGNYSLFNTISGNENVAIGHFSGVNNATGNSNTLLGSYSDVVSDSLSYATALGSHAAVSTSNTIVLGRTTDTTVIGATGTATSGILQNKILQVTGDVGISGNLTIGGTFTAAGFSGNGSGLTNLNASNISSGMLAPAYGGTGVDGGAAGNGQLLIGNGSGYSLNTITAGTGVGISNGSGSITISNTGVTSFNGRNGAVTLTLDDINSATYFSPLNFTMGYGALPTTSTGDGNTGVGILAMNVNSSGGSNTAVGARALFSNTSGSANTALGRDALYSNSTGASNTAVGYAALGAATNASNNTAMGDSALTVNTTGGGNTAVGKNSLFQNSTGGGNTVIGGFAMLANTSGFYNSAVGYNAGNTVTTGTFITLLGAQSDAVSNLDHATAVGAQANVSSSNTVVLGRTTDTTVIGATGTASSGVLAGTNLQVTGAIGATGNLLVGGSATFTGSVSTNRLVVSDTTNVSQPNIAIGSASVLSLAQSGIGRNIGLGIDALKSNTSGQQNVAIGTSAGQALTTGLRNTAVGDFSLLLSNGSENAAVGSFTLFGSGDGSYNAVLGNYAAQSNTTGSYNVGLGFSSLYGNTTGAYNTAVGGNAGLSITTGQYNTLLGYGADVTSNNLVNATAIGAQAKVSSSNTLVLGRAGTDQVVIGALSRDDSYASTGLYVNGTTKINGALYATSVTQTSDRRLKTNIQAQDSDFVLDRLSQLSTYTYEYINHPDLGRKIGVIAQEVKPYFPEAVVTSREGFYSVDYNALGAMAAVGVGKLNVKYNALNTEVQKQGGRLTDLEGRVNLQDTRIADLEGWKSKTASRLDGMQTAIDSNIANIAASALKISMNTTRITTLEQVTTDLDKRVTLNAEGVAALKGFWNNTFETQDDGQTLALKIPNFKVSNFSAEQVKANAVYAQRLEAEVAKLKALQVDDLYAKNATAGMVHADELNTGTSETYAGVGNPGFLFSAKDDGHYTVNTSSPDGSYATATVIVYGGVAKVIPVAQQGIELFAVGNQIKANAAGKSIKASWLKMG